MTEAGPSGADTNGSGAAGAGAVGAGAGAVGAARPGGPVLLVLADSLAFYGPERAEPADDPRLWHNQAATALGGRAELLAGYGWTARHAW
ncbi:MAG: diglucosylglycerate octanoyltransferase, partial [Pseudonocardiales bacterium]|nr:diglucosylglycerate octanoyltransferase [Pseudonocardiales bacterium]